MNLVSATARVHPHAHPLRRATRALLATLEGFIAIGAVYGGYNLIADAEGFGVEDSWLDGTPFPSYTVPGVFLIVAIGGGMLAAAATTLIAGKWAALAALVMGVILIAFVTIETMLIGYQGFQQTRLLAMVGVPALVMVAIGSRALGERPRDSRGPTRWSR